MPAPLWEEEGVDRPADNDERLRRDIEVCLRHVWKVAAPTTGGRRTHQLEMRSAALSSSRRTQLSYPKDLADEKRTELLHCIPRPCMRATIVAQCASRRNPEDTISKETRQRTPPRYAGACAAATESGQLLSLELARLKLTRSRQLQASFSPHRAARSASSGLSTASPPPHPWPRRPEETQTA